MFVDILFDFWTFPVFVGTSIYILIPKESCDSSNETGRVKQGIYPTFFLLQRQTRPKAKQNPGQELSYPEPKIVAFHVCTATAKGTNYLLRGACAVKTNPPASTYSLSEFVAFSWDHFRLPFLSLSWGKPCPLCPSLPYCSLSFILYRPVMDCHVN